MDKVEISKLLNGFYGYPKTFVCNSLLSYKKEPLENKNHNTNDKDDINFDLVINNNEDIDKLSNNNKYCCIL